jgi:hypothetical protein
LFETLSAALAGPRELIVGAKTMKRRAKVRRMFLGFIGLFPVVEGESL